MDAVELITLVVRLVVIWFAGQGMGRLATTWAKTKFEMVAIVTFFFGVMFWFILLG